jgi:hypothetical protein
VRPAGSTLLLSDTSIQITPTVDTNTANIGVYLSGKIQLVAALVGSVGTGTGSLYEFSVPNTPLQGDIRWLDIYIEPTATSGAGNFVPVHIRLNMARSRFV